MKYQIRLLNQNLPGLTREIAQAFWHAADGVVGQTLGNSLYRDLYREVRDVFRKQVQAFRYCNAASICEASIPRSQTGLLPRHERHAGEQVHVYLLGPEVYPNQIMRELVRVAVKAVALNLPRRHLRGLADALRHAIEKIFEPRVFRSVRCGGHVLCHANEPYDPWDLRDPINAVLSAS